MAAAMVRDGFTLGLACAFALLPMAARERLAMGATPLAGTVSTRGARLPAEPRGGVPASGPERVARASDGMFYLTARVNGQRIRFLVDTGATMVVLARRDAAALGFSHRPDHAFAINTAAGTVAMHRIALARVDVAGHRLEQIEAAVAAKGPSVSLLGLNVLSRIGGASIEGDELRLR